MPAGLGTGFFYDAAGYLLTNHHVIESASRIEVKLADGRELEATRVGQDPPTDVAVLRVAGSGFTALPLGDSKRLASGDWVVAIGTPFGLEHTVSAGIVSAKGRTRDEVSGLDPSGYFNFIQTDAAINVGCSGGPLLNLAGQAVGINAAVRERANNIGFAIPMEMVIQLLPRLLSKGRIQRSSIGIAVHNLSQQDARLLQGRRAGAKVIQVFNDRAGERAGLLVGDIVLRFGDEAVNDKNELRWLASIAGVGKRVPLEILRNGKRMRLAVTLEALPAATR